MIRKDTQETDDTEDALIDAAIAKIEAWPIVMNERTALYLAIASVIAGKSIEQVAEEIIEAWGDRIHIGHEVAAKLLAQQVPSVDARRLRSAERKAMKPSIRLATLQRDGHKCRSCGVTAEDAKLHVDHVVPVSKGGKTELGNLQALCESCNLAKAAKVIHLPCAADAGVSRSRK